MDRCGRGCGPALVVCPAQRCPRGHPRARRLGPRPGQVAATRCRLYAPWPHTEPMRGRRGRCACHGPARHAPGLGPHARVRPAHARGHTGSHSHLDLPCRFLCPASFVLSAVSPAVVVPSLLHLQSHRYGTAKGIPSLVLASASFDDVLSISAFGLCLGLAFSEGARRPLCLLFVAAHSYCVGYNSQSRLQHCARAT